MGAGVAGSRFTRAESIALLHRLAPTLPESDANRVVDAVGDLPLALALAASVVAEVGMSAEDYVQALAVQGLRAKSHGTPPECPVPLAAAVRVSVHRLATADKAAAQLLHVCAALAPDPVPIELFSGAPDAALPDPLGSVTASPGALRDCLARLRRYGLAEPGPHGLLRHPLVHAAIADTLRLVGRRAARGQAASLLVAAAPPDDGSDPRSWPRWANLLPHLIAVAPTADDHPDLRDTVVRALWYQLARGDTDTALRAAEQLHLAWRELLGPDARHTLIAAHLLAHAQRTLGCYEQAYALDKDVLSRCQQALGEDEPETAASAAAVALDLYELGRYEEAYALGRDLLDRRRRVLGDDHPEVLTLADNVALQLYQLGRYEEARAVAEDVLIRRRRILDDDHPDTLTAASNLSFILPELGRYEEAHALDEDVLARRRRILGENHPDTLMSASNHAAATQALGRHDEARALAEDVLSRCMWVLGDDHPTTLKAAANLACDLRALGHYEQARAWDADVLARQRRRLGEDHPETIATASSLAIDLLGLGHNEQARALFEDVLVRRRQILGDGHPDTVTATRNLAVALELGEQEHAGSP
ncbi:MAG TPA: FxSxx-COOH system tetratricopeptide repeat protein [Jiangellales bacterium]|nr:FxSxx-COOH system tetratricopeptide repeat protein [Jiangellales bacterium]